MPERASASARRPTRCLRRLVDSFLDVTGKKLNDLGNGARVVSMTTGGARTQQRFPLFGIDPVAGNDVAANLFEGDVFAVDRHLVEASFRSLIDPGVENELHVGVGENDAALDAPLR